MELQKRFLSFGRKKKPHIISPPPISKSNQVCFLHFAKNVLKNKSFPRFTSSFTSKGTEKCPESS